MAFWNKKITLHCYTTRPEVFYSSPIVKANKMLPKWWNSLPSPSIDFNTLDANTNMKACAGFVSMYSKGAMIPLWSDLIIDTMEEGDVNYRWKFADGKTDAVIHNASQRGEYLPEEKYSAIKISSPWAFHCDEDVDWVWHQPVWNFDNPEELLVPPAIVNYNQYSDTNINIVATKSDERKQILLEAGQAMVHLVPLSERQLEIKQHLVSEEEYNRLVLGKNSPMKFIKNWIHQRNNKLKCPFHRTNQEGDIK